MTFLLDDNQIYSKLLILRVHRFVANRGRGIFGNVIKRFLIALVLPQPNKIA